MVLFCCAVTAVEDEIIQERRLYSRGIERHTGTARWRRGLGGSQERRVRKEAMNGARSGMTALLPGVRWCRRGGKYGLWISTVRSGMLGVEDDGHWTHANDSTKPLNATASGVSRKYTPTIAECRWWGGDCSFVRRRYLTIMQAIATAAKLEFSAREPLPMELFAKSPMVPGITMVGVMHGGR